MKAKFTIAVMALFLLASAPLVVAQTLQILHLFGGTDGSSPPASLTLGNDGNLYGTTYSGGQSSGSYGTVFRLSTDDALTTLYSFPAGTGGGAGTNGEYPGFTGSQKRKQDDIAEWPDRERRIRADSTSASAKKNSR